MTATLRALSYLLAVSIRVNGPFRVVIPAAQHANKQLGTSTGRRLLAPSSQSKLAPSARLSANGFSRGVRAGRCGIGQCDSLWLIPQNAKKSNGSNSTFMRVRDDGDVVEQKAPTPPPVVPFNSLKVNDNLTLGSFHAKAVKVGRAKKIDLAEILHKCKGVCDWLKYKILDLRDK